MHRIRYFLCLMGLVSCSYSKVDENVERTIVSPYQILDSFSLKQMGAKELEYVVLDTGEDYLIGQVSKVMTHNGYIFVLDQEYSESLYAFSEFGNLLFVISAEGDGPDAIPDIADFSIDTKRHELLLLSAGRKQVVRVSFEGEILSRVGFDAFFHFIAYHQIMDKIVLARVEGEIPKDPYGNAQVIILNDQGKVEGKYLPAGSEDAFLAHWFPLRPLVEGNGSVYFTKNFRYDVWEISNEANLSYFLNYGNRSIESLYAEFNANPEIIIQALQDKGDYIRALPLFFSLPEGKWLHILEGKNNQFVWHFIDITSGENHLFRFLSDDIDNGYTGLPVGSSHECFYYTLVPEMLHALFQDSPESLPDALRDILVDANYEGDYPVLVKVKF